MRTRRDEIMEKIFAPIGVLLVVGGMLAVGTLATSCKSSVGVQQYQAEFEKAEPLNTLPAYTGERQIVQLSKLNVNKELWDIEDDIRDKERNQEFDNKFIDLARAVYVTNDKRAEAKKEINLKYGSNFVEEKSYSPY